MSPAVLSGTVRDPGGQPVPQARVWFASGPVPLPDMAALTGADGRFVLSAPAAGDYVLECAADGYEPYRAPIAARAGERHEVVIDLTRARAGG